MRPLHVMSTLTQYVVLFFVVSVPALFRAPCLKCGHIVCFADDPLIGTEGWCHKCHLCLRCQDILCEGLADEGGTTTTPHGGRYNLREDIIRKTATVTFVNDPGTAAPGVTFALPPTPNNNALVPYDGGGGGGGGGNGRKLKLPKLPNAMDVPSHSVRANMYRKANTQNPLSQSFNEFGKW